MTNLHRCLALIPFLYVSGLAAQAPAPLADPLAPTLGLKSAGEIDREWQRSVSKYDGERTRLLADAEKQANDGPFRPDWATLMTRNTLPSTALLISGSMRRATITTSSTTGPT
jgi:alpha-L-fucosidase